MRSLNGLISSVADTYGSILLPALYDMPGRAADGNGHTEPLNYVHPAGGEKHRWHWVRHPTAMSEARPVCLAACDCEVGARAADLPSAEKGAQSRDEAAVTVIEEKQILDDGGIVGTSDGPVWSRYPNG